MKITCECGNEMEFVVNNEGIEEYAIEEMGDYVKKDYSKFDFWTASDEAGIICRKCDKSIWYFA